MPASFQASLGSSCVVPGGRQTLIAHTHPGYTVAFNSVYPDGKRGDTYGGYGVYASDSQGNATIAWTVAQSAPTGRVTVAAGTGNGGTPSTTSLSYTLAGHC